MREIEFRGKCLNMGQWIYGSCIINVKESIYQIVHRQGINLTHHSEVLPETIGQYTGLTDKNGIKIFEGDIAKAPYIPLNSYPDIIEYFKIGVVVWPYYLILKLDCSNILDEERKLMHHRNKREVYCLNGQYDYVSKSDLFSKRIEVIGNIHDNPELLNID